MNDKRLKFWLEQVEQFGVWLNRHDEPGIMEGMHRIVRLLKRDMEIELEESED